MASIKLSIPKKEGIKGSIRLNGSKSISNRVLIIQALAKKGMKIKNLSNANDTRTLLRLLENEKDSILDAEDAGTTYRFLTAYLACRPQKHFLTGSKRMLERPIAVLVDALRQLGAKIQYAGKEGFPPLQIGAPAFDSENMATLQVAAGISSQYISALLLIAPTLPQGLRLSLQGEAVSEPYIDMTLELMQYFGVECQKAGNSYHVEPQAYQARDFEVESDWSAASYYYAIAALAQGPVDITLRTLQHPSSQGDACIADLMKSFGIVTTYQADGVLQISKIENALPSAFSYDCTHCPDLAQTLAVIAAGLGIPTRLTGLQTLKIKETDRIGALKTELEKLGAKVKVSDDSLEIVKGIEPIDSKNPPTISTYKDHRMAMAFAPLALRLGALKFDSREVVAKSYPNFWEDLAVLGFSVTTTGRPKTEEYGGFE